MDVIKTEEIKVDLRSIGELSPLLIHNVSICQVTLVVYDSSLTQRMYFLRLRFYGVNSKLLVLFFLNDLRERDPISNTNLVW